LSSLHTKVLTHVNYGVKYQILFSATYRSWSMSSEKVVGLCVISQRAVGI